MKLRPLTEGAPGKSVWPAIDPYPAVHGLVLDFIGSKTCGRPFYKLVNDRYADATQIPGWSYSGSTSNGMPRYAETRAGKLVPFANGVPRITDRGLLVEEARTNFALDCLAPGIGAGWTSMTGGSSSPVGGPDGGAASASRWTDNTANTGHRPAQNNRPLTPVPTTISCYFRAGNHRWVRLTSAGNDQITAVFDAQAKTYIGAYSPAGAPTNISAGVSQLGNTNWYRIWLTFTPSGTYNSTVLVGHAGTGVPSTAADNYVGAGTYTDFFGFQLEYGAAPSSIIPTTSSPATRAADSASIAGLGAILGQFRTNLARYSADASNAQWQAVLATKTPGQPDQLGGTGAALITADGTNGLHLSRASFSTVPFVSGVTYTLGRIVKADTQQFIQLTGDAAVFGAVQYANFDIVNGVVTAQAGLAAPATIVDLGGGWFRISISVLATATLANHAGATVFIAAGSSGRIPSNTLATSFYDFGAMVEVGTSAGRLIVTTNVAVSVGNPFTVAVGAELPASVALQRLVAIGSDLANRTVISRDATSRLEFYRVAGGTIQTASYVNGYGGARLSKAAMRVSATGYRPAVDGTLLPEVAALPPVGPTTLEIGASQWGTAGAIGGYIQNVAILGDVDDAKLRALAA